MHTRINDWKNGWYGIELYLKEEDIDRLIARLQMLKHDHGQHFHLSSDYTGSGGVGDIEISVQPPDVASNIMSMSMSKALGPGESAPDVDWQP